MRRALLDFEKEAMRILEGVAKGAVKVARAMPLRPAETVSAEHAARVTEQSWRNEWRRRFGDKDFPGLSQAMAVINAQDGTVAR